MSLGLWDIVLLIAVSLQATVLSYVHNPKWKAFIWTLPIPFTLASMALGRPIDATNVMGIVVVLIYAHAVRILYQRMRVPIGAAIVVSALIYCLTGWQLAGVLPKTDSAFWLAAAGTFTLGVALYSLTPGRKEPGHRSPLPVYIKLPLVAVVILFLILIKNSLQGFMTFFPMVGVVAAYEARNSLWTLSRQAPVIMMTTVPLMAVSRLTHHKLGLGPSLALGWVVFALALAPLTRHMWSLSEEAEQ